jgi:hypothetical protein
MSRASGLGMGAAVALAAWVQLSDRTRSWEVVPRSLIAGARDALLGPPDPKRSTAAVAAAGTAPPLAEDLPLAWPGGSDTTTSFLGLDFEPGTLASPGGEDWRSALVRLEDTLADCATLSLDALLDLDLRATEDLQMARTPSLIDRASEATGDATSLAGERSASAIVVAALSPPRQVPSTSGTEVASARHITTSMPASDTPRPRVHVHENTAPLDRRDSPPDLPPSRSAVVPPPSPAHEPPAPRTTPGPFSGSDAPPGFGPHTRGIPRPAERRSGPSDPGDPQGVRGVAGPVPADHRDDEAACDERDGCTLCPHEPLPRKAKVCDLRHLVMARQRLLENAPAAAFTDHTTRLRVRARLGRALRSIDRALTRSDDAMARGHPARARTVGRRIDAYEGQVRSRTVERGLVDPGLTRALHFPVGGLAHWR